MKTGYGAKDDRMASSVISIAFVACGVSESVITPMRRGRFWKIEKELPERASSVGS